MSDDKTKPTSASDLSIDDDLMDPIEEPAEPEIDWLGDEDEDDDEQH